MTHGGPGTLFRFLAVRESRDVTAALVGLRLGEAVERVAEVDELPIGFVATQFVHDGVDGLLLNEGILGTMADENLGANAARIFRQSGDQPRMESCNRAQRRTRAGQLQGRRAAEAESDRGRSIPIHLGLCDERVQCGLGTRSP